MGPLVDSPAALAQTIVAVAAAPSARAAAAVKLVDNLERDLGGAAGRLVAQHHALMVRAVESAIADPTVQRLARQDLTTALTAAETHRGAIIDLRPLLYRVTEVMHGVDPQVPAHSRLHHAVVTIPHGSVVVHHSRTLLLYEAVLVTLGALGAALTAGRFVRTEWGRLATVGAVFVEPAVGLALVGAGLAGVARHLTTSDVASTAIARAALDQLGAAFAGAARLFAGLAAAAIVAWSTGRWWARRRAAGDG
ncbi:MAG: hypothetical protein ACHQFZ_01745 [Acidimicrobiales bacterium]